MQNVLILGHTLSDTKQVSFHLQVFLRLETSLQQQYYQCL